MKNKNINIRLPEWLRDEFYRIADGGGRKIRRS